MADESTRAQRKYARAAARLRAQQHSATHTTTLPKQQTDTHPQQTPTHNPQLTRTPIHEWFINYQPDPNDTVIKEDS